MDWEQLNHLCIVRISETIYENRRSLFESELPKSWKAHYRKKKGILFLYYQAKTRPSIRAADILKQKINLFFRDAGKTLSWAHRTSKRSKDYAFPTGEIYILLKPGVNKTLARSILKKSGLKKIVFQPQPRECILPPQFENTVIPEYARQRIRQAVWMQKPDIAASYQKTTQIIATASTGIDSVFSVIKALRQHAKIQIATPGFVILHQGLPFELHNMIAPPETGQNDMIYKNQVSKAWQLFYPQSGPWDYDYPGHFLCSRQKVAVLDYNFFDHPHIKYSLIGFDAFDYDTDPRTPDLPPGVTAVDTIYSHGTFMSGIIAGVKQNRIGECGVAPGTDIIPIRPVEVEDVDIMEDTEQYCLSASWDWWYTFQRLYYLSQNDMVRIANYSATVNEIIWRYAEIQPWFEYFITRGSIFFAVSAGNNPDKNEAAYLAQNPHSFAVAWADFENENSLGNYGNGIDICVEEGNVPFHWTTAQHGHVSIRDKSGSSGSCALVSGVAALMQEAAGWIMSAEEMKTILRLTTRYSRRHNVNVDEQGWNLRFGYGFLDAFHAVKVAYKSKMQPVQAQTINFLADGKPALLIQTTICEGEGALTGKPSGVFWCLREREDEHGHSYWQHLRLAQTWHCDVVLDSISPMGKLLGIGDFDGDGCDEIALQMDYWVQSPEHHFIIRKYNEEQHAWKNMGTSIPAGNGIQWAFNIRYPMSELITARLTESAKSQLIARQNNVLNVAQYEDGKWKAFGPLNYLIKASSDTMRNTMTISSEYIVTIKPFPMPRSPDALLVIGSIVESKPHPLPYSQPYSCRHYTVCLLAYNTETHSYEYLPLNRKSGKSETHLFLAKNITKYKVKDVLVADFTEGAYKDAIISIGRGKRLHKIILFAYTQAMTNTRDDEGQYSDIEGQYSDIEGQYSIYEMTVPRCFQSIMGKMQAGDVDGCGKAEIIKMVVDANGDKAIRAWRCDSAGWWQVRGNTIYKKRKDNTIKDFYVCDYGNGEQAQVGVLMEKPHANTYRVYRMKWVNSALIFTESGLW